LGCKKGLKWFANFLRVSREHPWVRYTLKKNGRKKRKEGVKVIKEPLSRVAIS
jgi:hypothetical protein